MQLYQLSQVVLDDANKKDIQLYFTDSDLEAKVQSAGWSGAFDEKWKDDFLMAVDANLNAWKSDWAVSGRTGYEVDLSAEKPTAKLTVTYEHTAKEKDFMTKDYRHSSGSTCRRGVGFRCLGQRQGSGLR